MRQLLKVEDKDVGGETGGWGRGEAEGDEEKGKEWTEKNEREAREGGAERDRESGRKRERVNSWILIS